MHQAAVPLLLPTNHITAALLARFSLRVRCCPIVCSDIPGIANAARKGEVGLFELPSMSVSVARRARPPHTEGSETRLLEKLVPYAASVVLSCLVVFVGLRHLDPNREASKKALEHKKEIAERLGRLLI